VGLLVSYPTDARKQQVTYMRLHRKSTISIDELIFVALWHRWVFTPAVDHTGLGFIVATIHVQ